MERFEFRYKTSDYQHKPLGYTPILWFDYLRSRTPLANENKLWGFVKYLQQRLGAPSSWQVPLYLLLTSRRKIWLISDWWQKRLKKMEKA